MPTEIINWTFENEKYNIPKKQDAANAVLRGKVTVVNAYLRKQERSQQHNFTSQGTRTKSKVNRRKEIKFRVEIKLKR